MEKPSIFTGSNDKSATESECAIKLSALGKEYTINFSPTPNDFLHTYYKMHRAPYELSVLESMARLLRPGDLCVDVGANIGNHTLFLATIGCIVEAFEPNEIAYALLEKSISDNNISDKVTLHKYGVGVESGKAYFKKTPDSNLGAWGLEIGEGDIPVVSLDSMEFGQPIRILKIDVEGMECEVLAGAKTTIAKHRPVIYLEMLDHYSMERNIKILDDLNYSYYNSFDSNTHSFIHFSALSEDEKSVRLIFQVPGPNLRLQAKLRKCVTWLTMPFLEGKHVRLSAWSTYCS